MEKFYSNGKLLITGEYLILDGAIGLGLPTQKGQSLTVETNQTKQLKWESFDCHQKSWYNTQIAVSEFMKAEAPVGNSKFDTTLFKILWHAQQLNNLFLNSDLGYSIKTQLTFERLWGLGTSSTLINNIANWAQINPFELLNLSFGGSGYDIACAKTNTPIHYQKTATSTTPQITSVIFDPPFKNQIFFIYLNEKKDSKEAINNYRALLKKDIEPTIEKINTLTNKITNCKIFEQFEELILEHEAILSSLLKTPTVKQTRFPDFKGAIKSLGGWGGDFVLATGKKAEMTYFKQKGYTTIIPFDDMILK